MKDWKSLFNFIVANTNKVEGGDSIVIKSFKNMLNDFEVKK